MNFSGQHGRTKRGFQKREDSGGGGGIEQRWPLEELARLPKPSRAEVPVGTFLGIFHETIASSPCMKCVPRSWSGFRLLYLPFYYRYKNNCSVSFFPKGGVSDGGINSKTDPMLRFCQRYTITHEICIALYSRIAVATAAMTHWSRLNFQQRVARCGAVKHIRTSTYCSRTRGMAACSEYL